MLKMLLTKNSCRCRGTFKIKSKSSVQSTSGIDPLPAEVANVGVSGVAHAEGTSDLCQKNAEVLIFGHFSCPGDIVINDVGLGFQQAKKICPTFATSIAWDM